MKTFFSFLLLFCLLHLNVQCKNLKKETSPSIRAHSAHKNFVEAREQMVRDQIERRGILDSLVLAAMRQVPRHLFVPEAYENEAYADHPLPIGYRQTISQPYIVAFMTAQLQLKGQEKVLEIGTGSGYQAAILGTIARAVYTIEIVPELARQAQNHFREMNYPNIFCKAGDGYQGWPDEAPFDAIMVTAAPNHIPQPLIDQLKPVGRMILPVGDFSQDLILLTKSVSGEIHQERVLPVRFVPMTGEAEQHK